MSAARRRALGAFLRRCREQRQPVAAGLAPRGRRRSPGLRREDVAILAGISTTWYTWIEQGRDISVSQETLNQIANALDLNGIQRSYLTSLAQFPLPAMPSFQPELIDDEFRPLLDSLETTPAVVLGTRFELLGFNQAARKLFPVTTIQHCDQPNLIWTILMEPNVRRSLINWEHVAKCYVAELRKSWARYADDERLSALIRELRARSPEFSCWWGSQTVSTELDSCVVFDHPSAGRLSFVQHGMQPNERSGLTLLLFVPLPGTDTSRRIRELLGGPALPV